MNKVEVFQVIKPGPLTTIQDLGRYGFQQFGIPVSGAMDDYALRLANLLVGNHQGEACLEITLMGLQLRVIENTIVAITGADLGPVLNKTPFPMWEAVGVHRGDTLCFPQLKSGCRAYLAISGGFDVPKVMGSAATCTKAQIGGLKGPLHAGDRLWSNKSQPCILGRRIPPEHIPEYKKLELRVVLGPQDDHFTSEGIRTFLHSEYTISDEADRMGYRLEGPPIEHKGGADIISDGNPLGAVQVPGNQLPIILMADRQTTGGYTKIATVITADIMKLAQTKPGDKVRFVQVTLESAQEVLREYEQTIHANFIACYTHLKRRG